MINVGIHENVRVKGVELREDPKGDPLRAIMVLTLELGGAASNSMADLLAAVTKAEETVDSGSYQDYYFWPFDNKDKDGKIIEYQGVLDRAKDLRAQLTHILSGYMVKDTIEKKWDSSIFANTGITPENAAEMLVKDTVVNKIFRNICNAFIELITPFVGDAQAPTFRVKFIRQSTEKHFSKLPRFAPFWEPMDIPKGQSKLAYTKWEVEHKANDGTPSPDAPAADKPDSQSAAEAVAAFGSTDDLPFSSTD